MLPRANGTRDQSVTAQPMAPTALQRRVRPQRHRGFVVVGHRQRSAMPPDSSTMATRNIVQAHRHTTDTASAPLDH